LIIVPLASHHQRQAFDCGEESLNVFLRQFARQGLSKRISRTSVAVEDETAPQILGYHTTLVTTLKFEQLPAKISKAGIPALLLARLAVDVQQQGRGIGEFLLLDVLRRAVIISEQTGLYAVVLDALNERARKFYLRYGFEELVDDPLHLFLPIETILKLGLTLS
jgi:GNAT superfamily N-acetyltransferase